MSTDAVLNILNTFSGHQRAFEVRELLLFVDSDCPVDTHTLLSTLTSDQRFVCLQQSGIIEDSLFVPKTNLLDWLINLNLRLGWAYQRRLGKAKLALLMDSLGRRCGADIPIEETVRFGQQFGLIAPAWTQNEYVFPLAHLMSFMSTSAANIAASLVTDVLARTGSNLSFEDDPRHMVMAALSKFERRVTQVVHWREGLLDNKIMTLEQIGKRLGLTRERVRQIEMKFWEALRRDARRHPFKVLLAALLRQVIARQGSLVIPLSSPDTALTEFLCRCAGVPCCQLEHIGLMVLGTLPENIRQLQARQATMEGQDIEAIAHSLESVGLDYLSASDTRLVAERLASLSQKRFSKAKQVYLALKQIGRPAHYSGVTEVYNSMFPRSPSTEHNIHAILDREQHGVVWIGVRGTFALKEWGYERPSEGLHDTVSRIVNEKFQETGRPVHFTVISAEIAKYRRVVKPSSLAFATFLNPRLRCVSKDLYVPATDQETEEQAADEMDRKFREWERGSRNIASDCQRGHSQR